MAGQECRCAKIAVGLSECLDEGFEVCFKGTTVSIKKDGEVVGKGDSAAEALRHFRELCELQGAARAK